MNVKASIPIMNLFQIYPDENHGLSGVFPHLHLNMENFFTECLGNFTLLSPSDTPYTLSDVKTWEKLFWSSNHISFLFKPVANILSWFIDKWTKSIERENKLVNPAIDKNEWPGSREKLSSKFDTYSFRSFILNSTIFSPNQWKYSISVYLTDPPFSRASNACFGRHRHRKV